MVRHKQIDHVLIDRRLHSSILDVRNFRAAEYDTDHYLLIANVRESVAVGKQAEQRFDWLRFNLRMLNEPEVRERYQIEITTRLAALGNGNDEEDVNRTWENIKENIQTSAEESLGLHELNQNKPWFDEECLGFLDRRKRTKLQLTQDPNKSIIDILNNVRREVSRHFKDKRKHNSELKLRYMKLRVISRTLGSCIGGINYFKKG